MASPTQWTWVWAGSGSWWWTGKPGVLQSMGLQRVGHNWATEPNWTEYILSQVKIYPNNNYTSTHLHNLCFLKCVKNLHNYVFSLERWLHINVFRHRLPIEKRKDQDYLQVSVMDTVTRSWSNLVPQQDTSYHQHLSSRETVFITFHSK